MRGGHGDQTPLLKAPLGPLRQVIAREPASSTLQAKHLSTDMMVYQASGGAQVSSWMLARRLCGRWSLFIGTTTTDWGYVPCHQVPLAHLASRSNAYVILIFLRHCE